MKKLTLFLVFLVSSCMVHKSEVPTSSDVKKEMLHVCFIGGDGYFKAYCDLFQRESKPVRHEHAPIVVATLGEFKRTKLAVDYWNKSVGFKLFVLKQYKDLYDEKGNQFIQPGVLIAEFNSPPEGQDNTLGLAFFLEVKGKLQARIGLFGRGKTVSTLIHELGHAVGLAHDKHDRRSIMYPYSSLRYMPRIQPVDKKLLRQIYKK